MRTAELHEPGPLWYSVYGEMEQPVAEHEKAIQSILDTRPTYRTMSLVGVQVSESTIVYCACCATLHVGSEN